MTTVRTFVLTLLLLAAVLPQRLQAQSSATIARRLSDLETLVSALTKKVSALETEKAAHAARIASLEGTLASIKATQNSQQLAIQGLQGGLQSEVQGRQTGDAATLTAAKAYTDTRSGSVVVEAKAYADSVVDPVADKLVHFSRRGTEVYITGANLNIRNGSGHSYNQLNGLGNLTIGYNELRQGGDDVRTGSHNLILGFGINHTGAGGLLCGAVNTGAGLFASVLGGTGNTVSGLYSTISGGFNNTASGNWSTIGGGSDRVASSTLAHIP
jgi:hypothetical protein